MSTQQSSSSSTPFQWTIARKIGGLATVLIIIILCLIFYSALSIRDLQKELREIASLDVPLAELVNKIEIQQLEQQITMDQLIRLSHKPGTIRNRPKMEATRKRLLDHTKSLEAHIAAGLRLSKLGLETKSRDLFAQIKSELLRLEKRADWLHKAMDAMIKQIFAGQLPNDAELDEVLEKGVAFDEQIITLIHLAESFMEKEIS